MTLSADTLTEIIRFIDLAGVLANAILGGIAARSARLDMVGFIILAVMSGLGGGLIRDTLLQHGAPVALTDPAYLVFALAGGVVAFFIPLQGKLPHRSLILLDALAVGCWAAAGVQKTLDVGLWWLPAVMLGVITAVGGGMVRDLMLLKVPTIFGGNTLYATSALLASIEMVVLSVLGFQAIGSAVAILSGALLSLLARRYGWILPTGLELHIPKSRLLSGLRTRRTRR